DGRLGACVHAGLQGDGAREIHRSVLPQRRLADGGAPADGDRGDPSGGLKAHAVTARLIVLVALTLLLGAGCRSLTGRPLGRWVDDRAVTAAVKSELASLNASPRTRISVDTYDGIVYLSGVVDDEEGKRQAQSRARSVAHVEQVVVNVQV